MSYIPENMTEQQVLNAIEQAVNSLASIYKFGYHDVEDIKQEGRLLALEVLKNGGYDGIRPLNNFLFTHIRNRLSNNKRNKFRRNDPPCKACHEAQQTSHPSMCSYVTERYCKKYASWQKRNNTKQNLMNMLDISVIDGNSDFLSYENAEVEFNTELKEIQEVLDEFLTAVQRKLLLKIKAGESVSKVKRQELEQHIREILVEHGINLWPTNLNAED